MAFKQDELDQLQRLLNKQKEDILGTVNKSIEQNLATTRKEVLETASEMFKQQRKDINNDIGEAMSMGFDAVGEEQGVLEARV